MVYYLLPFTNTFFCVDSEHKFTLALPILYYEIQGFNLRCCKSSRLTINPEIPQGRMNFLINEGGTCRVMPPPFPFAFHF